MNLSAAAIFISRQTGLSAAPLLLAGFGELIAQRAGVINIGIEGAMLMGAIAAFATAVVTGSAALTMPAAILIGLLFGALFAVVVIWFRADQIVAGTAMNLLAAGSSTTAWGMLQHSMKAHGSGVPPLYEPVTLPGIAAIPGAWGAALGTIFSQYLLFYAVVPLGIAIYWTMTKTRTGLIIRALGDAPDACDAAGIRVRLWRTAILLLAGAMAGAAGAYLSTMRGHSFQINMTGGQGFLVLALVIFGRWNILYFAVGTLAFGALDGLQSFLAAAPEATQRIPHQLFDMLPYAATLIALAVLTRSKNAPIHLGRPWPES